MMIISTGGTRATFFLVYKRMNLCYCGEPALYIARTIIHFFVLKKKICSFFVLFSVDGENNLKLSLYTC